MQTRRRAEPAVVIGRGGRPTIADVARLAGVARGTASKALNGSGQLRSQTRRRVLAAAEELGFAPSPLARGLSTGRTGAVGLLTTNTMGRLSLPVLRGADDALSERRTAIMLCDARSDPIRERYYLTSLVGRGVDGLIVLGHRTDPRPSITASVAVPVVYVYSRSDDDRDHSVVPDDVTGARLAAEHLLTLGRRRIGFVGGGEDFMASQRRLRGTRTALESAGLPPAGPPVFGPWHEVWGRRAARLLLEAAPELDGLVCASDQLARGALDGLHAAGVRVPDDVAVVGFDNWDDMVTASQPPLTSVDMRLAELGRVAAARLLRLVDGLAVTPGPAETSCELVVRESTMGARARRPDSDSGDEVGSGPIQ